MVQYSLVPYIGYVPHFSRMGDPYCDKDPAPLIAWISMFIIDFVHWLDNKEKELSFVALFFLCLLMPFIKALWTLVHLFATSC